jgi:membrane-associated phospholipid phosphatase
MPRMAPSGPRSPSLLVRDVNQECPPHRNLKHAAAIVACGYALLVVVMLAIGFTLTHLDSSVGRWDESVNRWFANHRTDTWNSITGVATWFVNTVPAIGLAVVITAALALRARWREAAMLWIALSLELLVFLSVTFVVARPRPNVVRLNSTPSTSSFPSGHTAAATVIFAGLAIIVLCCTARSLVRALALVFAVLAATTIGFARVYRGLHHPTDVLAGALLGAGCLLVAVIAVRAVGLRKSGAEAEQSAPMLSEALIALPIDPVEAARYEQDLRRNVG